MRGNLLGAALLLVAGCNGQEIPAKPSNGTATPTEAAPGPLVLSGSGIAAGEATLRFGAAREEAEALASKALGVTPGSSDNDECGAGPMGFSHFPGGLTLNYRDGKLMGWYLPERAAGVALDNGLAIGSPQAQVEALPGFVRYDDSTLGEEFYFEPGRLGGFFEQGKVISLYAGTNCFFR